jgi:hypothetical protein
MSDVSPEAALSQLNSAQNAMRRVRKTLPLVRDGKLDPGCALESGWASLLAAHRALAAVPLSAANDDVMSRQIAVGRYATALLVRLRRLARKGPGGLKGVEFDDAADDGEG